MKVTKLMLASLPEPKYKYTKEQVDDYNSNKTELYHLLEKDKTRQSWALLLNKGTKISNVTKPSKQVIHAHPSQGGFKISVHGVLKRRT